MLKDQVSRHDLVLILFGGEEQGLLGSRHFVRSEYEVHGEVLANGATYDNRLVSIATIENRKIVRWRDYMNSLAAWTALTKPA